MTGIEVGRAVLTVAEVISHHVTWELESIDRMYCNVYVPPLQREGGVAAFFREHRGYPFASSALMDPISKRFVAAIHTFVQVEGVPLIIPPDQRKEDVAAAYRADFRPAEGVVLVGRAQEKTPVFRTEKRRNPRTGQRYPWLVRSTAMVNHFYFYCVDRDFGPFRDGAAEERRAPPVFFAMYCTVSDSAGMLVPRPSPSP